MAFARAHEQFQQRNCDLLGLSIDSNFAHIAWVRNIKEKFDVDIPFPVIEDLSMSVACAYGMIQPGASDTSTERAKFLIVPQGVLRAMVYYPISNGRSVDEYLRLLTALQMSDENGVATPENWQAGEEVIVPPPQTTVGAERARNIHVNTGVNRSDFVVMREARDKMPRMPVLSLPSVQVNIRAGEMPPAECSGTSYLKNPIDTL